MGVSLTLELAVNQKLGVPKGMLPKLLLLTLLLIPKGVLLKILVLLLIPKEMLQKILLQKKLCIHKGMPLKILHGSIAKLRSHCTNIKAYTYSTLGI